MLNDVTGQVALGALLLVSAVGAWILLDRSHRRRAALRSMRAPSQWPITARELAGPDEHEVWQWLCEVFADDHVMLMIPQVRSPRLLPPQQARSGTSA